MSALRSVVVVAQDGEVRLLRIRQGSKTTWQVLTKSGEESFDLGYQARCRFDRLVEKEGHQK